MSGKSIIFDDKMINKINFYKSENLFKIDDIYGNIILVSKKEPYGRKSYFKHFIGYNDNDDIRSLYIKLLQMICNAKNLDSYKTMSFKVGDKKTVKMYTKIWGKNSSLTGREFDSEPVYSDNGKYIKTKIKSNGIKKTHKFSSYKNTKRKLIMQMFVFGNVRFCC